MILSSAKISWSAGCLRHLLIRARSPTGWVRGGAQLELRARSPHRGSRHPFSETSDQTPDPVGGSYLIPPPTVAIFLYQLALA